MESTQEKLESAARAIRDADRAMGYADGYDAGIEKGQSIVLSLIRARASAFKRNRRLRASATALDEAVSDIEEVLKSVYGTNGASKVGSPEG